MIASPTRKWLSGSICESSTGGSPRGLRTSSVNMSRFVIKLIDRVRLVRGNLYILADMLERTMYERTTFTLITPTIFIDPTHKTGSATGSSCPRHFLQGPEYTGNCVSSNGKLTLFTCNPSSPIQIAYDVARGKQETIYKWVREFCERKKITGNICFDFMEDKATGSLISHANTHTRTQTHTHTRVTHLGRCWGRVVRICAGICRCWI